MKYFILLCAACCIASISFAQRVKYNLSGTITDVKTGMPLAGASVMLADSRNGTLTDSSGHYSFSDLATGHSLVEISYRGYRSLVLHLDLEGNTNRDFELVPAIIENEGVTVTATGSATSLRKSPVAIIKINKEKLMESMGSNIISAISRQPGISQVTTGPAISKPVIRGLGFNRLVVINDGIRQEGQQWGDEHGIEIDDNSVSQVEIVKGPASLVYGSDALAGVINIITTAPVPAGTIKGNLLSTYNTNNRQRSLFASLGANKKNVNWNGWGDIKYAGDYQNKYDGYVWNSKFNETNWGGSMGLNRHWGYSRIIFSNFHQQLGVIEADRDSTGAIIYTAGGGVLKYPSKQDFISTKPIVPYQEIHHQKLTSLSSIHIPAGNFSLALALQRNQRQEFGDADAPSQADLYFDLPTFNYNISYAFHSKGDWDNTLGLNGMVQQSKNKADEVLVPEYRLWDAGGYFHAQKNTNKLTLSGGVRFDHRNLNSKGLMVNSYDRFIDFTKKFSAISASAGLSYSATANQLFKLNFAKGFRAPSIPELASNGAHEGTNRYEYGNVKLNPETSYQADAGYEVHSDHARFTFSAFYNRINNFIFYRKLLSAFGPDSLVNGVPAFIFNQQVACIYGLEAVLDVHPHPLDWLHWETSFCWLQGNFKEAILNDKDMPLMPPLRAISQVKIEKPGRKNQKLGITWFAEAEITGAQRNVFSSYNTETNSKGYTLINSGFTFSFFGLKKKLFDLYLLGNNLGDVAYQSHLSRLKYAGFNEATGRTGVYNMGRAFVIKLNLPLEFKPGK